jgi:hypothetical protein
MYLQKYYYSVALRERSCRNLYVFPDFVWLKELFFEISPSRKSRPITGTHPTGWEKKKVKISLLQAVEAPRVARGRGSHIT